VRIVSIAAECEPWAKTGGLGDVVDALARAIGRIGGSDDPVDVFLPRYASVPVPEPVRPARRVLIRDPRARSGRAGVGIIDVDGDGYRLRLVDHPAAFDRPALYGYDDDPWRFAILCEAALRTIADEGAMVDILHLHDWHTGPAAILRETRYATDPVVSRAAIVMTIHNLAYQGWVLATTMGELGLGRGSVLGGSSVSGVNLLRSGIEIAERVNTVSPTFARESLTPAVGFGLETALAARGRSYSGILNGLDTELWDPATDSIQAARYDAADTSGKGRCRADLLTRCEMDPTDTGMVAGAIGRFDPQKGFDLIAGAARAIIDAGVRLIVQGAGSDEVALPLRRLAAEAPDRFVLIERFDREMARRIYAGSDAFLMPSRFEPCGQGQMIAMRYGTPPIVHRTGGLADTVIDEATRPGEGTGFVFEHPTVEGLAWAIGQAVAVRQRGRTARWRGLVARAMAVDHDWRTGAAPAYLALYERAMADRRRALGAAGPTARRQARARRTATRNASG
jgi:starch synthase